MVALYCWVYIAVIVLAAVTALKSSHALNTWREVPIVTVGGTTSGDGVLP